LLGAQTERAGGTLDVAIDAALDIPGDGSREPLKSLALNARFYAARRARIKQRAGSPRIAPIGRARAGA
jgi:hypothetical protein